MKQSGGWTPSPCDEWVHDTKMEYSQTARTGGSSGETHTPCVFWCQSRSIMFAVWTTTRSPLDQPMRAEMQELAWQGSNLSEKEKHHLSVVGAPAIEIRSEEKADRTTLCGIGKRSSHGCLLCSLVF